MVYRPPPPPLAKNSPYAYGPLCPTVFCFAYCIKRKAQINGTVKKKNNKNTVNNLILPNTVSQNDENRIPKS